MKIFLRSNMKRIIILLIIVTAAGLLVSCKKKEQTPEKPKVVQGVKIETAKSTTIDELYEAVGTIHSKTSSVLSAKVVGQVLAIHVREGDHVKVGQLLIELDG